MSVEALNLLKLIPEGYMPLPHQVGGHRHVDGKLGEYMSGEEKVEGEEGGREGERERETERERERGGGGAGGELMRIGMENGRQGREKKES